jgi:membrane protein
MDLRRTARAVFAAYDEHDVLTYASAISFQIAFALIPLALCGLGLLGLFNLGPTWQSDIAPQLRSGLSPEAFKLVDNTVHQVLDHRRGFWATLGLLLTIWEMSGATRGVMGVLDRIYRIRRTRSFRERVAVSIALATASTALIGLAVGTVLLGPHFLGPFGVVVRWAIALLLLSALLAIVVRYAPAQQRSWRLVSRGSGFTLAGWVAMSLLFAVYLRDIADYNTIFGNLATVIVTFEYLYLSAIVFLTGLVLDALSEGGTTQS